MTARTRPAPNERLRVAALMDTAIVSGPGRQLAALATALRDREVDLRVVLFEKIGSDASPYREFLAKRGVDHVVVPYARRIDPGLYSALRRTLDDWRPHVVQTHNYRPTALVWLLRRFGAAWRWLGFFHGATNEDAKVRVYHWLDRQLLPAADRVVVMSREQAGHFEGRGAPVQQIFNAVLPVPPTPPNEATRAMTERVMSIAHPRVGVIGRLSTEKGVDVLLRALRLLRDRGAAPSLVIAGDGIERGSLEALARELGVDDVAHFIGAVLPIEPLYPLLDLVVIPSRSEGLPNVLLEAFRADIPVVSTRVGAVPEVLEGTTAGRMVPKEDPAALADAIAAALGEGPAAGRDARAEVARRFSLDQRVDAHLRIYREVTGA